MATEASQPLKMSIEAAGDLSASQYKFIKLDSNGKGVAITALTDVAVGVLQNKPKAAGQMCEVVVVGVTKLIAVGTIAPTANLAPDANGLAVTAAITGLGGSYVQGTKRCVGFPKITANTSANDVFQACVNCLNPVPAT